jgi:hypothetical protein
MSWSDYSRLHVAWPYVIRLTEGRGALYYFGVAHTYDPKDAQLVELEEAWKSFRPDIALTEGGSPPIEKTRLEAILKGGEPGLVRFLAARDNVPTTTLDPSRAEEVAALSGVFSKEDLKLFFLLRGVSQFVHRNGHAEVGDELRRLLAIYDATPGLRGSPATVEDVERAYQDRFPGRGRYDDVPEAWFDPVRPDTRLNDIARASSDFRDAYVVRRLREQLDAGHRVFAVMGGSHVVMQEPALRSRLRRSDMRYQR